MSTLLMVTRQYVYQGEVVMTLSCTGTGMGTGGGKHNRIRLFGSHYTLEGWINGYGVTALFRWGEMMNWCREFESEFELASRKRR
jgi:hypothetical protein